MTNLEKYNYAFTSNLKVKKEDLPGLKYQGIFEWDSVGHMDLIADLEMAYGIHLDTKDVLDLSSYEKGFDILAKYGVDLSE
ncbi:MAG: acyl carrier protein [Bacillota bacterium]|nr:acyl carrier protein [Bacillota bacterium]